MMPQIEYNIQHGSEESEYIGAITNFGGGSYMNTG